MKKFDEQQLVEAYKTKKTCRGVSEIFGCSDETVRRALIKYDVLRVTPKDERKKPRRNSNKTRIYTPVRYERTCKCCGKEYIAHDVRSVFCTKRCKNVFYNYDTGRSPNGNPNEIKKICIVCGKPFSTRREAVVTCSTVCSKKRHNHHVKKDIKQECVICGKEFITSRTDRKTCGNKECQRRQKTLRDIKFKKIPAERTVLKTCTICGKEFNDYPNGTIKTCSKKCSDELKRSKHGSDKRVPKGQRIDNISLKALYRRDNGACYICGKVCDWTDWNTSKNGNKYPGDAYPTKDHVTPISKGGLDSWENVRLAHWKCNLEKADGIIKIRPMSKNFAYSEQHSYGKKKTEQYSLEGELIKIWESTADIKRTLGFNDGRIQEVCRGKGKTAFGYIWKYAV